MAMTRAVLLAMTLAVTTAGLAAAGPQAPAQVPAQPPAPGAPSSPVPAPEGPPPSPAEQPQGFTYDAEGRRDPFVSLLRRGATANNAAGIRPPGLPGLSAAEVTLRGTVASRDGFVAILQGSDQRTYIVRAGDKLFDGTIRAINQSDLVIVQEVNDPLSLEKQREVKKVLRQPEAN